MMQRASSRKQQAGVSLLEVLIAVLIMAIGMLGIAALQAVTLKNTGSSVERTNAVIQSYAMLDIMRANREAARAGQFNQSWLCAAAPTEGATNANAVASVNYWISQLHGTMGPSACGRIECSPTSCEVSVRWDESRATGGESPQSLITITRL